MLFYFLCYLFFFSGCVATCCRTKINQLCTKYEKYDLSSKIKFIAEMYSVISFYNSFHNKMSISNEIMSVFMLLYVNQSLEFTFQKAKSNRFSKLCYFF